MTEEHTYVLREGFRTITKKVDDAVVTKTQIRVIHPDSLIEKLPVPKGDDKEAHQISLVKLAAAAFIVSIFKGQVTTARSRIESEEWLMDAFINYRKAKTDGDGYVTLDEMTIELPGGDMEHSFTLLLKKEMEAAMNFAVQVITNSSEFFEEGEPK